MKAIKFCALAYVLVISAGCTTNIRPVSIASRTPLENEITANFEQLTTIDLLKNSEREQDLNDDERDLRTALIFRAYSRKERLQYRKEAVIIEQKDGRISLNEERALEQGYSIEKLKRWVSDENNARSVLFKYVMKTSKDPAAKDMQKVQSVFHQLQLEENK